MEVVSEDVQQLTTLRIAISDCRIKDFKVNFLCKQIPSPPPRPLLPNPLTMLNECFNNCTENSLLLLEFS